MASSEENERDIKSKPSRVQAFIKFVNRTQVPVDIVWRGFNGEFIRYHSRLAPQCHFNVNTFESHPWQVWNSDTLQLLNVKGDTVFYPQKWNGQNQRVVINIDEPVVELVKLCLAKVKSLVNLDDLDRLNIPRLLTEELKKREMVEIQDYIRL